MAAALLLSVPAGAWAAVGTNTIFPADTTTQPIYGDKYVEPTFIRDSSTPQAGQNPFCQGNNCSPAAVKEALKGTLDPRAVRDIRLVDLVTYWVNFALIFLFVIAVGVIMFAGYQMLISGDTGAGAGVVKNVAIGIVVIGLAYAVVNTVSSAIGGSTPVPAAGTQPVGTGLNGAVQQTSPSVLPSSSSVGTSAKQKAAAEVFPSSDSINIAH